MELLIKILSGPRAGEIHPVEDGLSFGRKEGKVLLSDPKVSSLHAEVVEGEMGQFFLVDRDSIHQIEAPEGKVRRLRLAVGTTFRLGRTKMQVIDGSEQADSKTQVSQFARLSGLAEPPKNSPRLSTKGSSWKTTLATEVPKLVASNLDPVPHFGPFRRVVRLEFIQGVQSEKTLVLGFGPRIFGSDSLDVELQDPSAPPQAFEILPDGNEARFINRDPSTVRLSHRSVSSELLKQGDLITFGQTVIEVTFL